MTNRWIRQIHLEERIDQEVCIVYVRLPLPPVDHQSIVQLELSDVPT